MTTEQFRAALKREPFAPFAVHLADGRSVGVKHPEQVAMSQGGRTVVVVQPDDSWNAIVLLLVTDIEFFGSGDRELPDRRSA